MRERVAVLDGTMELLSAPGRGVTIRVEVPLSKEA
jgi:signal transduction histidine kinase